MKAYLLTLAALLVWVAPQHSWATKSNPTPEAILQSHGVVLTVASLIQALENDRPEVRENAATVLGKLGARNATEALRKRVDGDVFPFARLSAAAALAKFGDNIGRFYLLKALLSDDSYQALQSAEYLWEIDDFSGFDVVTRIARTGVLASERVAAIREIGRFRNSKGLAAEVGADVLIGIVNRDSDVTVRRSAAEELVEYRGPLIARTFLALRSDSDPLISALAEAYIAKRH